MAEWSIASDLKSEEPYGFREFESHSLLFIQKSCQREKKLLSKLKNLGYKTNKLLKKK